MTTAQTSYSFGWFDRFCLWYPPGWMILFNRHWQHYHADPDGWNGLEYGLFLLPGGFYLAVLLRWLRLGCRAPRTASPLSPEPWYQQALQVEVLQPIAQRYFRAELRQIEHLPSQGRLLVVMNHAGMCFPWDFLCLGMLLGQARGWQIHPVTHPIFFDHDWLRWWLPPGWVEALGGIRADKASFAEAIAHSSTNAVLLYAPEGWRGLVKGWPQRYQLTTFDPSFIRLSYRYRIPILPVICMGSESLHPWTFNWQRVGRWLKLPLFPVSPLMLAFLCFPSMGLWAAKTRLHYYLQPLTKPWENDLPEADSLSTQYDLAQQLRADLQQQIDRCRLPPSANAGNSSGSSAVTNSAAGSGATLGTNAGANTESDTGGDAGTNAGAG